jgi:hypothetical protein
MKKRLVAGSLWFYAGWYAGVMLADLAGTSAMIGPLAGLAVAGLIVADPRRVIWTARTTNPTGSQGSPEPA